MQGNVFAMKKHAQHNKPVAGPTEQGQQQSAQTKVDGAQPVQPQIAPAAQPAAQPAQQQVSPEELQALRERAAKADEYWDRLLRTAAELENFKKRVARERHDTIKFANESLIQKLIPVLDNFEMALAETQNAQNEAVKVFHTGVAMIHQQLRSVLESVGLEEVDARGKPFDPSLHEAVAQHETTEVPDGHVFRQIRKGYKLNGRLVRPASVVVAHKPAQNTSQSQAEPTTLPSKPDRTEQGQTQ